MISYSKNRWIENRNIKERKRSQGPFRICLLLLKRTPGFFFLSFIFLFLSMKLIIVKTHKPAFCAHNNSSLATVSIVYLIWFFVFYFLGRDSCHTGLCFCHFRPPFDLVIWKSLQSPTTIQNGKILWWNFRGPTTQGKYI